MMQGTQQRLLILTAAEALHLLQVHCFAGKGAVLLPLEARHPPRHQARKPAAGHEGGHLAVQAAMQH